MIQRSILATQHGSPVHAHDQYEASFFPSDFKNALIATAQHLLRVLGLCATIILVAMFFNPELAEKFKNLSPFSINVPSTEMESSDAPSLSLLMATPEQVAQLQTTPAEEHVPKIVEDSKLIGNQRQQLWVTNWLAKRYRVASDASNMLVSAAYLTAKEIKLDPLLILSVMAIESGLNPFAESPVGAQGLMQVMSKIHHEKFQEMGGIKAALNPVANIKVGALILKDYVTRGGSVEAGLKLYVGAAAFENDGGYGARVLAEYRRLKDVATGKNVPTFVVAPAPSSLARPQQAASNEKLDDLTNRKTDLIETEQLAKL